MRLRCVNGQSQGHGLEVTTINDLIKGKNKKTIIFYGIIIFLSMLTALFAGIIKNTELTDIFVNIFCALIVSIAAITDFIKKIIPNAIVLTGMLFGIILIIIKIFFAHQQISAAVLYSVIGCAFSGGVFIICAIIVKNSVGMGDIKIFGMLGFIYGFEKIFSILFFSLFTCAVCGIILLLSKKKNRKDTIALAPFALIGLLTYFILGG